MSLLGGDLTVLATAKAYLDSPPSDAVLGPLITRISRFILGYLNRGLIIPRTVTEYYNGQGTQQLVPAGWPIIKVNSLIISGINIPVAPQINNNTPNINAPVYGYRIVPWNGIPPGEAYDLELINAWFVQGNQNVVLNYTFGYGVTNEVPLTPTWQPLAPYGIWASDNGVFYKSSGVQLVAVNNPNPSPGFYTPPAPDAAQPTNVYIFNPSDISQGLLINYGYIPSDLEQVCLEMIAERATYRKRVAVRGQGLAGQETMQFDLSTGIPLYAKYMLQPYVNVIPPAIGADV
jgi:hypothetical protein